MSGPMAATTAMGPTHHIYDGYAYYNEKAVPSSLHVHVPVHVICKMSCHTRKG